MDCWVFRDSEMQIKNIWIKTQVVFYGPTFTKLNKDRPHANDYNKNYQMVEKKYIGSEVLVKVFTISKCIICSTKQTARVLSLKPHHSLPWASLMHQNVRVVCSPTENTIQEITSVVIRLIHLPALYWKLNVNSSHYSGVSLLLLWYRGRFDRTNLRIHTTSNVLKDKLLGGNCNHLIGVSTSWKVHTLYHRVYFTTGCNGNSSSIVQKSSFNWHKQ